jgi:hypothetical protein
LLTVGSDVQTLGDVAQGHVDALQVVVVGDEDGLGGVEHDTGERRKTSVLDVKRLEHLHALGKVEGLQVGQGVPFNGSNIDQGWEVGSGEACQFVEVEFTTNDGELAA